MPGIVKKNLTKKVIIYHTCALSKNEKRQMSTKKKIFGMESFYISGTAKWSHAQPFEQNWKGKQSGGGWKLGKKNDLAYNAKCIWWLRRHENVVGVR